MRHCDPAFRSDLLLEQWNHTSLRAKHIPEPYRDASHPAGRPSGHDQLPDPLGTAHEAARSYGLVGGDKQEILAIALAGDFHQGKQSEHVVLHRLLQIVFHKRNVLVSRSMKDGLDVMLFEDLPHTHRIG